MKNVLGYVLQCHCCQSVFVICKSCYRGHKYCSEGCRINGYNLARQKARHKFEKSIEAKLDHRDRSRRYRLSAKKSVTDKSSNISTKHLNLHLHENLQQLLDTNQHRGVCISCQQVVFDEGVHIYGGSI